MNITARRLSQGDESTLVDVVRRHKDPVGFVWGYLLQRLDRDKRQLFIYEVDVSRPWRVSDVATGSNLKNDAHRELTLVLIAYR